MFVRADIGTQCCVDGWGGVGWFYDMTMTRYSADYNHGVAAWSEPESDGHAFQIEKDKAWLP